MEQGLENGSPTTKPRSSMAGAPCKRWDGSSTQSITNTVDEIIDDFVIPDNLREDEETHKLARRLIQEAEARIEVETDEEEETSMRLKSLQQ